MRLSAQQRHANETRIRAVIDRLLAGHVPAGTNCDVTSLARLAGIDRAAFYGNRPYAHLREEFEQRIHTLREAGQTPNPHQAQLATLREIIGALTERLGRREATITELTQFKTTALSRLAAQHEEILRLRADIASRTNVHTLRRSLSGAPPHTLTGPQPGTG
jgi:hypothetical protein